MGNTKNTWFCRSIIARFISSNRSIYSIWVNRWWTFSTSTTYTDRITKRLSYYWKRSMDNLERHEVVRKEASQNNVRLPFFHNLILQHSWYPPLLACALPHFGHTKYLDWFVNKLPFWKSKNFCLFKRTRII